jgi:hypothetical protein
MTNEPKRRGAPRKPGTIVRGFRLNEEAYKYLHAKFGKGINSIVNGIVENLYKDYVDAK